jgi:hypothetical protein
MTAHKGKTAVKLLLFFPAILHSLSCKVRQKSDFQKTIGSIGAGAETSGSANTSAASLLRERDSRNCPAFLCRSCCLLF